LSTYTFNAGPDNILPTEVEVTYEYSPPEFGRGGLYDLLDAAPMPTNLNHYDHTLQLCIKHHEELAAHHEAEEESLRRG
jgi:hypothetical protein